MMNDFFAHPPLWGYLLAGVLGTASWRLLGAIIIGHVDEHSMVFQWITAVAYGMAAALLIRVLIMPQGNMEVLSILIHSSSVALAVLLWWVTRKNIMLGLLLGFVCYVALQYIRAGLTG